MSTIAKFSSLLTLDQQAAIDYMHEDFDIMCANYIERVMNDVAQIKAGVAIRSLPVDKRGDATITVTAKPKPANGNGVIGAK